MCVSDHTYLVIDSILSFSRNVNTICIRLQTCRGWEGRNMDNSRAFSYHHGIYSEKQLQWMETSPADSNITSEEARDSAPKLHANFLRIAVRKSTSYYCSALTTLPNADTRNPKYETHYHCDAAKSVTLTPALRKVFSITNTNKGAKSPKIPQSNYKITFQNSHILRFWC